MIPQSAPTNIAMVNFLHRLFWLLPASTIACTTDDVLCLPGCNQRTPEGFSCTSFCKRHPEHHLPEVQLLNRKLAASDGSGLKRRFTRVVRELESPHARPRSANPSPGFHRWWRGQPSFQGCSCHHPQRLMPCAPLPTKVPPCDTLGTLTLMIPPPV